MIIMHNNNCVEEPTHKVRLFSVTIKGRVIKEEQILPNGGNVYLCGDGIVRAPLLCMEKERQATFHAVSPEEVS